MSSDLVGSTASRRGRPVLLLAGVALLVLVSAFALRGRLAASPNDTGCRDFSVGPCLPPCSVTEPNDGPTGEKPQSKLWFNDGAWWAIMFNPAAGTAGQYHIYRLSYSNQTWVDTGTLVDARRYSRADALWDGRHLYVATAAQPARGNVDLSARVYRFSYNPASSRYSLDAGFPVTIVSVAMEAIVIAKDTTGAVWATYTADNGSGGRNAYVTHSTLDGLTWVTPYVVPSTGATTLDPDDISAVVAYSGNIGVMWSNQTDNAMYFSYHVDGAPDNQWTANPAVQDPYWVDDHINLKSVQSDPSGRVFAAMKTGLDQAPSPNPTDPLILLLVLDDQGVWRKITVWRVQDNLTRPILLIDSEARSLWVFATSNNGLPHSGIIYKLTDLDNIVFPTGMGTTFMWSDTDLNINNATSTRQNVNSRTGLVVLASDLTTGNYWHNVIPLGPDPQPLHLFLPLAAR